MLVVMDILHKYSKSHIGFFVPAMGRSGGAIILWRKELGGLYICSVCPQVVHVLVPVNNTACLLNVVNESTDVMLRRQLWLTLFAFA